MNPTNEYWRKQTTAESHKQFWNTGFHGARVKQIISVVEKHCPETKTVLDAGAGTCRLGAPFVDAGYEYTAVDWSESMLSECSEKFKTVISDLAETPFIDNEFDCVVCSHVIRHNEPADYTALIDELCRVASRYVLIVNPVIIDDQDMTRMFKTDIPDFPILVSDLDNTMEKNGYSAKRRIVGLMTYKFKGVIEGLMLYEETQ